MKHFHLHKANADLKGQNQVLKAVVDAIAEGWLGRLLLKRAVARLKKRMEVES